MDAVLEKTYRVRPDEADSHNTLKPVAAIALFQDAAWEHARRLGLAVDQLRERNLTWVLAHLRIQFAEPIHQGDALRIRTWPFGTERLFALREFEVMDDSGRLLTTASSAWLILQLPGQKPMRPNDLLQEVPRREVRALDSRFDSLPRMDGGPLSQDFRVRWHDLDINGHVNNTVYPRWALECLPADIWLEYRCHSLEIQFVGMAHHGDQIQVLATESSSGLPSSRSFVHRVERAGNRAELTRLRSSWVRRALA